MQVNLVIVQNIVTVKTNENMLNIVQLLVVFKNFLRLFEFVMLNFSDFSYIYLRKLHYSRITKLLVTNFILYLLNQVRVIRLNLHQAIASLSFDVCCLLHSKMIPQRDFLYQIFMQTF